MVQDISFHIELSILTFVLSFLSCPLPSQSFFFFPVFLTSHFSWLLRNLVWWEKGTTGPLFWFLVVLKIDEILGKHSNVQILGAQLMSS